MPNSSATAFSTALTAADNLRFNTNSGTIPLTGDTTVNTVAFYMPGANTTLNLNGFTLRTSGLLIAHNADNIDVTITGGSLTAGASGTPSDLILFQANYGGTNRTVTLNAPIVDNGPGGAVRFIRDAGDNNASVSTLNAVNTNTGGTVVNMGTLHIGATGVLGTGGITVNQGLLTQAIGGSIGTQTLTLGGASVVTLANQANTVTSLVFNNLGGAAPTLSPTGTLTITTGITATTSNVGAIANITTGSVNLGGNNSFPISVGATTVNGKDVAPWQAGLNIISLIQNGGITKSGNGVLQLSAQNAFTGGVTVQAGGLILGDNSTPTSGTVTSGPVGVGRLTMGTGTRLAAAAASTLANNVTFGDDGAGTGTHTFTGINNLTLNGVTTLPSIWNAEITAPQMTLTIADATPSQPTDIINKSGLGTLIINNFAGTLQAVGGIMLTADGNSRSTVQTVVIGGDIVLTGDTVIALNRSSAAPLARNKIIQKANLTAPGNIVSVNNQSGYGLEFVGTTTLTGPANFAVANATASNLPSGLILTGAMDDGAGSYGLIKSGFGTLLLQGTNTFGGAGQTIDIIGGVLAANSDAALGDAANSVTVNIAGTTGVGFRATGTFTSARTFILNQANTAIEVDQGSTLTLTAPFTLSAVGNTLNKNDNGVLVLNAANPTWTGPLNINAGAIRLGNAAAAGTGAGQITVAPGAAALGAALQLAGDITVTNPFLAGNSGNQLIGGLDFGGILQNYAGNNTYAGAITLLYDTDIGSTSGVLTITGGITNTTTSRQLWFSGAGDIVLSGTPLAATGMSVNQFNSVNKYGTGTLTIQNLNTVAVATNGLTLAEGTTVFSGNSSWRSAVYIDTGATLTLDNTAYNAPLGRLGGGVLASSFNLTMRGGDLNLVGRPVGAGSDSTESFASVVFNRGLSTVTLTTLDSTYQTVLNFLASNAVQNVAPAQNGWPPPVGSSVLFRGTQLGSVPAAGVSSVVFSGGLNFNGQSGSVGSTTKGLLPWALVDASATGNGTSFATADAIVGAGAYLRPLSATEYSTNPTAIGGNNNIQLTAAAGTGLAVTASVNPNSLTFEGNAGILMADGVKLGLSSGGILVRTGSNSVIAGGVMNQTNSFSPLNIWTVGNLTITADMNGGNGQANSVASWIKAGPGTLTIAPVASPITGLSAIGGNSLSGLFVLNAGTLKLGTGLTNAIQANNYFVAAGGTLDLNGNSQQVYGFFSDSTVANSGSIVTSTSGTGHLYINSDGSRAWSGAVQGDVKLTRSGAGTSTFYSNQTYTGATLINGGNILLRDEARLVNTPTVDINAGGGLYFENAASSQNSNDRLNDAAVVNLRGGILELRGRPQFATTENVGTVNLLAGNSFINSVAGGTGVNSADLVIANLNRPVGGGTVNFTAATGGLAGSSSRLVFTQINGVSTATVGAGLVGGTMGILGGWAVIGTSEFASYIPGLGVGAMGQTGFPAYSNATTTTTTFNTATATDNISLRSGVGTLAIANDLTINSLHFGNAGGANTVAIAAGKTLTLASGGLMYFSSASQVIGATANQGTLTTTGPELFIYTQGTGPQVINSVIAGTGVTLVKSGANGVVFNGVNTYGGGTTVNQGTITVGVGSLIPLATDPTKGLVVNAGTVTLLAAGQIATGNTVTLNGGGVVNYFGDNTQYAVVFNNNGSLTTPVLRTFSTATSAGAGSTGVLTIGAGGLTATASNLYVTSVIDGRVDFGPTANTITVGRLSANGVSNVDPLRQTLDLQGIVGSTGGITKLGNGVLYLGAQASFTGGLTIAEGGLMNGIANAGSRFSRLTIADGARYDLANIATTWGSLAGAGDIFSSAGTPVLNAGFDDSSTTFSGRFIRFNDAAYSLFTKVGTGTLTLTGVAGVDASFGAMTVSGGTLAYAGAGIAYQSLSAAATGSFVVNSTGVLKLDNSATNIANRLGANIAGTVSVQGGRFVLQGSAAAASTETIITLNVQNGGGRVELTPGAGNALTLSVNALSAANSTGSLVIGGIDGTAGADTANFRLLTANFVGSQGGGIYGTTHRSIRPDILADSSATGQGTGFLTGAFTVGAAVTTLGSNTVTVGSTAGLQIGSTVTGNGLPAGQLITGITDATHFTITTGSGVTAQSATTLTIANHWRALSSSELNLAPLTWTYNQNAGLNSAQTIAYNGTVNSLTTSGAASLGSSLDATFGDFGSGGGLLTLTLANASAVLVKDGTTTLAVGSLTGSYITPYFHVLTGATLNVNASLGVAGNVGLVKAGGGVMNLNRATYYTGGNTTVNGGTLNLNSGAADTLAVAATASAAVGQPLYLNGPDAVVDLLGYHQAVGVLANNNALPGTGGTVTNSGGSPAVLTSIAGGTFAGALTGNLAFTRSGNNTTLLTSASSFTGETIIRGGTLQLRDGGALGATSAVAVYYGTLSWDNYGLNPAATPPVRIPAATPVTLQGGTFAVTGAGSTDNVVAVNTVNLAAGYSVVSMLPNLSQGSTLRTTIGNLARPANNHSMVNFSGFTTLNLGNYNDAANKGYSTGVSTLGAQGLTGSSNIFVSQINGSTGPANLYVTGGTTADSPIVTLTAGTTAQMFVGMAVSGAGIPAGQFITEITDATHFTMTTGTGVTTAAGSNIRGTNLTNNIIGGWAIAGGWAFATYDNNFGVVPLGFTSGGFTSLGYDSTDLSAATGATTGFNYSDNNPRTFTTGTKAFNTWTTATSGAQDLTVVTGTVFTIGTGIVTNAGQTMTFKAVDASNTITGTGPELYIYNNQGNLVFQSKLTGGAALVLSGPGTVRLEPLFAANDYTGGTFVNSGTLNLNAASGLYALPGNVTLAQGALTMSATVPNQIIPTASVTINGNGSFTLPNYALTSTFAPTQTLASFTFQNDGGTTNPSLAFGTPTITGSGYFSTLILSSATPITATNNSFSTVPTISTGAATLTALQFSSANPSIVVNAGLAPTSLVISAPITQHVNMLSLSKTGNGALVLSGQNTFTTGFNLTAGALIFGANSTPSAGTVTAGPIGTGALNISAGTSLFSDNSARTIANAVVVNGDFTFGGRTVGANLTLSGPINLGAVARAMSVASPAVTVTLSGVLTSTAGSGVNGLTKTGNGTLVLTGANTDTSLGGAGITVAGGILRQGAANVVPVSSLLTVNAGAGFDLFGFDYPTNGFTGTGFITNSANAPQTITATITSTQSFAGKLADNSGHVLTPNSKLALTKAGAGTLVLNGASMNVGATTITAGLLELGAGGVLGTGAVDIQPTAVGTGFSINRADAVTLVNDFISPGRFTQKGTGTTSLTGTITNALINVDAGVLQIGIGGTAGNAGTGEVTLATGGALAVNRSDVFTLQNTLSGTGGLTMNGTGTLLLAGANTYAGPTTFQAGTIRVSTLAAVGSTPLGTPADAADPSRLIFTGGALEYTGAGETTVRSLTIANGGAKIVANGSGALIFSEAAKLDFDNAAATSRTLTLDGANTGDNRFAPVAFEAEALGRALSNLTKAGAGTWIVATSTAFNGTATVDVSAGTLGFEGGGLGTATGDITITNSAALRWEAGNADDVSARLHVPDLQVARLVFADANTAVTFNSGLRLDGSAAVYKEGAGTLILNAANTLSAGALAVHGGTVKVTAVNALGAGAITTEVSNFANPTSPAKLIVNSANSTAGVDVDLGGRLSGTGSVGAAAINVGGTIASGTTTGGSLTVSSLRLAPGANIEWQIWNGGQAAGVGYSRLNVLGNVDLSTGDYSTNKITVKVVSLTDPAGTPGSLPTGFDFNVNAGGLPRSFSLATVGGVNFGSSTNINDYFAFDVSQFQYGTGEASLAGLWSLSFDGGSAVTLTAVPEPSTYGFGIGALALALAAIRRRRQSKTKQA